MKDTEFAYAVARVRSNENKLLSSANIESLINSADYKEAVKILADVGYGNFETDDEQVLLSNVLRQAFELIYSSAPDKKCLNFLIVKNDFHNIKAILKGMVANKSVDTLLLSPSVVEADLIKAAVETKNYSSLPEFISCVVKKAYEIVTTSMDGQQLEIFLDRMSIEASVKLAEESKDKFSVSLANLMCAISDIKIALRCQKTGKDKDFIKKALAECKIIDTERLCNAALQGSEALSEYVRSLGFGSVADNINHGYAAFEKACDDLIMDKIKDAKYQCLGIAPLVAYYFAVDAEVKTVRIILSCKKNGVDVENIRERVRVLYV